MAKIQYVSENEIDIIHLEGTIVDEDLVELSKIVAELRQQQSTKLLILGEAVERIAVKHWRLLEGSFRHYRQVGGRIALAEFKPPHLKLMKYPSWFQYVNSFATKPEALLFLDPNFNDD